MTPAVKLVRISLTLGLLVALNYLFEYGLGDFQINPYYARIINLIGINITLAVSLNLINGLAGQFSIGHAGFMAVGGYTATYLTVYYGKQIAALVGSTLTNPLGALVVMVPSLAAGALAAVAGGLSGQLFANPLNPQNLNFVKSIEVIVMIVLGGIGSITGAVLGATTLTILPEALRSFDQQFPGLRMVIYALLLILLMIFRPQGLLGRREFSWRMFQRSRGVKKPVLE